MGLFDLFKGGARGSGSSKALEVAWSKNADGKFRRLNLVNVSSERLDGIQGIFIVWHGGVKPGWVYVGLSDDLASDLQDAKHSQDIMEYNSRGGLYVTWQTFPDSMAGSVFAFLSDVLQPEVRNPDSELYKGKKHVKVIPPGYTKETFSQLL